MVEVVAVVVITLYVGGAICLGLCCCTMLFALCREHCQYSSTEENKSLLTEKNEDNIYDL